MTRTTISAIRVSGLAAAILVCAAGTAVSAPAAAQPTVLLASSVDAVTPPSPEAVRAQREQANRLTIGGQFKQAAREWNRLARMQRAQGELPIEALQAKAEIYHSLGFDAQAAAALRELGEDAGAAGNAELSARSLLHAAILYQRAADHEQALRCIEEIDRLIQAPSFDPEMKSIIESRIVR